MGLTDPGFFLGAFYLAIFAHGSDLRRDGEAPQPLVDYLGDIVVDGQFVPALYLDHHVKRRRGLAFQDALLGSPVPGFLISQGHGLNAANQVGKCGVHDQVVQGVAVGRGDQLHPPFGDGPGRGGLLLGAHLIDDDGLGHVVLNGFDHYSVLLGRCPNLHPPGAADGGVGHVAVAGDLVGRIDDDHPFPGFLGQDPGHLPQHGGFTHAGAAQEEDVLSGEC